MVEAFHANGIDVWLDVVYNHTSEAGRGRADLQLSRHRQPVLLPADRRAKHLPQRNRLRQHTALRSSGGPDADYLEAFSSGSSG